MKFYILLQLALVAALAVSSQGKRGRKGGKPDKMPEKRDRDRMPMPKNRFLGQISCPSAMDPHKVLEVKAGEALSTACPDLQMQQIAVPDSEGPATTEIFFTTSMPFPKMDDAATQLTLPTANADGVVDLSGLQVPGNAPEGKFYLVVVLQGPNGLFEVVRMMMKVPAAVEGGVDLILEVTRTETGSPDAILLPGSLNPLGALGYKLAVRTNTSVTLNSKSHLSMPSVVAGIVELPGLQRDWAAAQGNQSVRKRAGRVMHSCKGLTFNDLGCG